LRRAFSIFNIGNDAIEVLYRAAGKGTTLLSSAVPGANIDLLGPLGQPFHVQAGDVILVGGGVGVPPLVFLARHLLTRLALREQPDAQRPTSITAMIGARTRFDIIGQSELEALQVGVQVATDDGSAGRHGLVTDLLRDHLETKVSRHPDSPNNSQLPIVYSCGPYPMLRAVAQLCAEFQVPCQVSLEENMPCGIGVCNGCVVPVVQAGDDYGLFRRICVEGPVLWSHEVDWTRSVGH
jgi:dihydroorotate dehydrogenase electron transfer subunit